MLCWGYKFGAIGSMTHIGRRLTRTHTCTHSPENNATKQNYRTPLHLRTPLQQNACRSFVVPRCTVDAVEGLKGGDGGRGGRKGLPTVFSSSSFNFLLFSPLFLSSLGRVLENGKVPFSPTRPASLRLLLHFLDPRRLLLFLPLQVKKVGKETWPKGLPNKLLLKSEQLWPEKSF